MDTTDQAEPTAEQPARSGPRVGRAEIRDVGRLRRVRHGDRMVAGVAGGIARHFDIDPTVVRVGLVVLSLFGGGGILVYLAGWLLMPQDGEGSATLPLEEGTRGIVLLVVAAIALAAGLGVVDGPSWVPWPLLVIGGVGYLIWRSKSDQSATAPASASVSASASGPAPASGVAPGAAAPSGVAPTPPGVDPVTGYPLPPTRVTPSPAPPAPRRRGPILFLVALPVLGLALGTLGIVDAAGAPITLSAYPALALATIGLLLVLGAFWGRAGGLVLLGLVALAATVGTTIGASTGGIDVGVLRERPETAAAVQDLSFGVGDLDYDLTAVADVEELAGRTVRVEMGVGDVEVIVPDGIDVHVETSGGPGDSDLFGESTGGTEKEATADLDRPGTDDTLTLIVDLGIGDITVKEAA